MNSFTRDLLDWIENNLTGKLTIDDVSVKAGYSKWHLQRIFREDTGFHLASYIRYRKLNKAAMILRMTHMPAVEISELLGFSTQQTFTRSFTRHFGAAPGKYRDASEWNFRGMVARASPNLSDLPEAETVTQGPGIIPGLSLSYLCDYRELEDVNYHCEQRKHLLSRAVSVFKGTLPQVVAENFEPDTDCGRVKFTLTFQRHLQEVCYRNASPDRFLRFSFSGTRQQLINMQADIYQYVMPFRPEARRQGHDFFVCHPQLPVISPELNDTFSGSYYIPVSVSRGDPLPPCM